MAVFWSAAEIQGIELSEDVFPSEDEALEALRLGEISYQQYLTLRELSLNGIDSVSRHQIDEIPNLSFFDNADRRYTPLTEREQMAGFYAQSAPVKVSGQFVSRFIFDLDNDQKTAYRQFATVSCGEHFSARFRVNRETSGRERIMERSVTYESSSGLLRRLSVGCFSRRFGLGSIVGYRGRLFRYSDHIDGESLLVPDYGGMNGLLVRMRGGNLSTELVTSYIRNVNYRLFTGGAFVRHEVRNSYLGFIAAVDYLSNRSTAAKYRDFKFAPTIKHTYDRGYTAMEFPVQLASDNQSAAAFVFEGRHQTDHAELRYAGWSYPGNWHDLTAGSKTASLSRRVMIDSVLFGFSSRRSHQAGGLFRTTLLVDTALTLSTSLLYARINGDTSNTELSAALTRSLGSDWQITFSFLDRERKRDKPIVSQTRFTRHTQLEARFRRTGIRARGYIAHVSGRGQTDHLELFTMIDIPSGVSGRVQVWSNLARLDTEGIQYWYLYVRTKQVIQDGIMLATKLGYSYHRHTGSFHRQFLALELTAQI